MALPRGGGHAAIGPGQRELSLKRLFGHEHDAQRGALPRRPHATPALMAQSPGHAWAIMDTPMTATMEVADPYYRDGDRIVRARVMELLRTGSFTSPYRLRRGRIASRSTVSRPLADEVLPSKTFAIQLSSWAFGASTSMRYEGPPRHRTFHCFACC